MAAELIKFPSIEQYRNTVKRVREQCAYHGVPLPSLKFTGTVKLHGTNAGIGYDYSAQELWAQSRNNIITPEADNMGFARWVAETEPFWRHLFDVIAERSLSVKTFSKLVIFGEWCGQGIMKGVGISQVPKMFVIFDAKLITQNPESSGNPEEIWVNPEFLKNVLNDRATFPTANCGAFQPAYLIYNFPTYRCVIDFSRPEAMQNQLGEWTKEVEERCPVAAAFGVDGIGEGIVWRVDPIDASARSLPFTTDDLIFKVKGEKHSDTKVKTLAAVDTEKLASVQAFVDAVITDHRLEKGVAFLKEQGKDTDIKNIGEFLKWVGQDVLKEESDTLQESGLDRKDVMPNVAAAAKQWYMKLLT